MRTFVILLLLANLAFLGWNLAFREQSAPPVVRSPARPAGQTLQLLSELPAPETPVSVAPGTCISLGVFANTAESDFFVSALLQRGLQARAELVPSGETATFRVYMPPFSSDTAARQSLEALQAAGIDSFIVGSGELAGAISIGLFTREDLALAQQERLAGQGFATSIQEIVTASNEIWVTIEGLSQDLLEGSDLLDLLSEGLDLEVAEKPCETIASGL